MGKTFFPTLYRRFLHSPPPKFAPLYLPRQTCTSLDLTLKAVLCYSGSTVIFWRCKLLFYYGGTNFCSIMAVLGSVLLWRCKLLFYYGGANFCSIMAVQTSVLLWRCKLLFYYGGANFFSIIKLFKFLDFVFLPIVS
jgi:hypothetical protein